MCRIAPASSGSCATFAVYDPTSSTVHVANAGDTRALLVRRRESEIRSESGVIQDKDSAVDDNNTVVEDNSKVIQDNDDVVKDNTEVVEDNTKEVEDGAGVAKDDNGGKAACNDREDRWLAIPLSVDHTGRNESERERVNKEHPGEDSLINASGRLLGSAVTRSFGDNRWKWDAEALGDWKTRFFGRGSSPRIKTPPYITATPTIQSHKVHRGDFLVIASDGFWDHISNEDAAHCIGLWADARNADGDGGGIAQAADSEAEGGGGGHPYNWAVDRTDFVVEDENAATHLLRNVLGGRKRDLFCSVLSMKAPDAKEAKDDVTVIVAHF